MHVATKDLPRVITSALDAIGCGNLRDLEIRPAESVDPSESGGQGVRGFFASVNLATGETKISRGSWGGANVFNPTNLVDMNRGEYQIPPGYVAIKGLTGHYTCATIYAPASTLAPMLPPPVEVTAREKEILDLFGLISSYRKPHLDRARAEVDALIAKGWISRNKAGSCSITVAGKNARDSYRRS